MMKRLKRLKRSPRLALIGIGNELRGDDAVGLRLVQQLHRELGSQESVLMLQAGPVPENLCGSLRRFQPDLVILFDAAEFGQPPGTARWLAWQEACGMSTSTHTLPLRLFASYITHELNCALEILGFQPKSLAFGPVSDELEACVDRIVPALIDLLEKHELVHRPSSDPARLIPSPATLKESEHLQEG